MMNIKAILKKSVFTCALSFGFMSFTGQANALLLTDSLVFIGPKGGSAVFKLKNTAQQPESYRLEWDQLIMGQDGPKLTVSEAEARSMGVEPASPHMYVAPRRLLLQPGQLQNIRFMLRRNNNMAAGEYRSYITIGPEEIPPEFNPDGSTKSKPGGGQAAELTMLTGYRIPVFFLHGETTLDVSFSNVVFQKVDDTRTRVDFTLNRSGTRSALGDIEIRCAAPDGRNLILSRAKARVFKEIGSRSFTRYIDVPPAGCNSIVMGYKLHDGDPLASTDYIISTQLK